MEIGAILEGNVVDITPQTEINLSAGPGDEAIRRRPLAPDVQASFDGFDVQIPLAEEVIAASAP